MRLFKSGKYRRRIDSASNWEKQNQSQQLVNNEEAICKCTSLGWQRPAVGAEQDATRDWPIVAGPVGLLFAQLTCKLDFWEQLELTNIKQFFSQCGTFISLAFRARVT